MRTMNPDGAALTSILLHGCRWREALDSGGGKQHAELAGCGGGGVKAAACRRVQLSTAVEAHDAE